MNCAICTLFEGNYHYGVGALVNSLSKQGFRGTVWAGYRGDMPRWARPLRQETHWAEFAVGDYLDIRFVPLETRIHFTNYKPTFLKKVWEMEPAMEALFYFDPDIVINWKWSFFEQWATCGIALVEEIINGRMPANHPTRAVWEEYAEDCGWKIRRESNQCFNGGFVGVKSEWRSWLEIWESLIQCLPSVESSLEEFSITDPTHPFVVGDQVCVNITAMVSDAPLSTVGPDGMDFTSGYPYMSHSTMSPKPWERLFIAHALRGVPPTRPQRAFWRNVQAPIPLFSPFRKALAQADLTVAAAIGRFLRRS